MRRVSPPLATIVVAGLFVLGLSAGSWVGHRAVERATAPYADVDRFARMLQAVRDDHVEPHEPDALVDAAIAGMVAELDPHTRWMSANAVQRLEAEAEGQAVGFGIDVGLVDSDVVVLDVLPGSPAEREGLVRGDRILSIDGIGVRGLQLAEIEDRFGTGIGEAAQLEVARDGQPGPMRLAARRDTIRVPAVEGAVSGDGVMYVRVLDFKRRSAAELAQQIRALQAQASSPWRGLVLDLRDNTGGLLSEAVAVADLFLAEGPIVSVRGRTGAEREHHATPDGLPASLPVVVLVDGLTASASEIVAGALQEAGRAVLVGSPTYGKGSVQQLYRNQDGSALKLTVARYHLPSGAAIQPGEGLTPDVVFHEPRPQDDRERLRQAMNRLDVTPAEAAEIGRLIDALEAPARPIYRRSWAVPPERRLVEDPVVLRALEELR